LLQYPFIGYN